MSDKERIKRPKPERTDPIRSWSTLFGIPGSNGGEAGPGAASLQDVMARSVDLGYRVVDEYIRRGQDAAQRLSGQSYGPKEATNDLQELPARMAQYASDFATIWFEMMQAVAGSAARMPANPAYGVWPTPPAAAEGSSAAARPAAAPRADEPTEHTRVRIEVVSKRPTEVSLDLRSQAAARPLVVHALRSVDPEKPRLNDVTLHAGSAEEPAILRISVPEDHPAGIYNGLIIDAETSRPLGMLSVRVSDG